MVTLRVMQNGADIEGSPRPSSAQGADFTLAPGTYTVDVANAGGYATSVSGGCAADGKVIVYEDNFGLWKLDTASGKSSEIVIDIKADFKENEKELVTLTEAQAFSLSPSNKRAAIIAHGELFSIATDRGEPQRVSETAWKEELPRWSPKDGRLAFASDRTVKDKMDLFILDGSEVRPIGQITGTIEDVR